MAEVQTDVVNINLTPEKEVRILSGKVPGMAARKRFDLDQLDRSPSRVQVVIPVPVVTSSFILGMFSQSVERLGVEGFFDKYHFEASPGVLENIEVNARFSATEGTALSM